MKIIKASSLYGIEAIDGPTESITLESVKEIMAPIDDNRSKIISSAFSIERLLDGAIANYFFGIEQGNTKKQEFHGHVLDSDWCTFSAKRKMVEHIIKELGILTGPELSEFQKVLRRCMIARNIFAHGEFTTDGKKIKVSYFEGSPKSEIVTDEWLGKIEENLNRGFKFASQIISKTQIEGSNKSRDLK
jgi:hypothetical protein